MKGRGDCLIWGIIQESAWSSLRTLQSQDGQCFGWDSNRAPPERKIRASLLGQSVRNLSCDVTDAKEG
jgi:hypothetical protein